jgi:hypothetical protein
MIHHALGKDSEAEDFLTRALKTHPHFHIFHAEVASRILEDVPPTDIRVRSTRRSEQNQER